VNRNLWPAELETLDQLLGGPMSTSAIRSLFKSTDDFVTCVTAMLYGGELKLRADDKEVAQYHWAAVLRLSEGDARTQRVELEITDAGARRIA
jgi:hypothetical protein